MHVIHGMPYEARIVLLDEKLDVKDVRGNPSAYLMTAIINIFDIDKKAFYRRWKIEDIQEHRSQVLAKGFGRWQYQFMKDFADKVRSNQSKGKRAPHTPPVQISEPHEAIVQISKPDNVWRDLDDSRQKDDFSWAKGDDKDKEWGYLFQPPNRGKKRQQCDWSMQQQNKKKDWDSSVSSQEKEGNTVDGEAQHPVEYEIKYGRKRPKHLSYYSFDSGYQDGDQCDSSVQDGNPCHSYYSFDSGDQDGNQCDSSVQDGNPLQFFFHERMGEI